MRGGRWRRGSRRGCVLSRRRIWSGCECRCVGRGVRRVINQRFGGKETKRSEHKRLVPLHLNDAYTTGVLCSYIRFCTITCMYNVPGTCYDPALSVLHSCTRPTCSSPGQQAPTVPARASRPPRAQRNSITNVMCASCKCYSPIRIVVRTVDTIPAPTGSPAQPHLCELGGCSLRPALCLGTR